jgi:uncharacterized protein YggU (UPF0235/DUF167 family)
MNTSKFDFTDMRGGAALAVRIVPHSQRNEIDRILSDGTIKIKVKTSQIDENTNTELINFLAEILDVNQSEMEIVAGVSGRKKLVSIYGLDSETVNQRIEAQFANNSQ